MAGELLRTYSVSPRGNHRPSRREATWTLVDAGIVRRVSVPPPRPDEGRQGAGRSQSGPSAGKDESWLFGPAIYLARPWIPWRSWTVCRALAGRTNQKGTVYVAVPRRSAVAERR